MNIVKMALGGITMLVSGLLAPVFVFIAIAAAMSPHGGPMVFVILFVPACAFGALTLVGGYFLVMGIRQEMTNTGEVKAENNAHEQ